MMVPTNPMVPTTDGPSNNRWSQPGMAPFSGWVVVGKSRDIHHVWGWNLNFDIPRNGCRRLYDSGITTICRSAWVVLRVQAISLRDSPNIMISYYVVSFFVSLLQPAQQGTSRKDRPSRPSQILARPLSSPGRGATMGTWSLAAAIHSNPVTSMPHGDQSNLRRELPNLPGFRVG